MFGFVMLNLLIDHLMCANLANTLRISVNGYLQVI